MRDTKSTGGQPRLRLIDCRDLDTHFAPARRDGPVEVSRAHQLLAADARLRQLIDFVPDPVMVLNRARQILLLNRAADELLAGRGPEVVGQRPGEALHCAHAARMPGGCGTSRHCGECGAGIAMVAAAGGATSTADCSLSLLAGGALHGRDYRVHAHPMRHGERDFVYFQLVDAGDRSRREALERIFVHDGLNTAVALREFLELLAGEGLDDDTRADFLSRARALSARTVEDICAHRDLRAAEEGLLRARTAAVRSGEALARSLAECERGAARGRIELERVAGADGVHIASDPTLLNRVLCSLLRNAIEASVPGDRVRAGCTTDAGDICFWVNNPAYMPEEVQLQIFNRSFSTRGAGRGLGTYSARLLTERYLGGVLDFDSDRIDGTTFVVRLRTC
jgi:hypothetical protein